MLQSIVAFGANHTLPTITEIIRMYILWPQSLRYAVLLSLNLLVCSASHTYYIVLPGNAIRGENISFSVHWLGDSDLTVTAGIRNSTKLLSNVTKVIKTDSIEILTLPGIAKNTSFNEYKLMVNGSSKNRSAFSEIMGLPTMINSTSIIIQTDKALYKPGETVYIRIITINYDLKPKNIDVDLVIRDPRNNIVQQYLKMKSDLGVISTQFKLANSPMLGEWTIQANDDNLNRVFFSVAENVFQKFNVKLNVPSFFINSKIGNLNGTVTAKYLYGKPVKGYVTVTMKPSFAEVFSEIIKTFVISGSVNFSFTHEEISNITYWAGLNITATVYEELTGIAVEEYVYVRNENSEYRLNLVSQNPVFDQGLKFTAQIQVERIDNKSLTKEEREKNVSIVITQGTGAFVESIEISNETDVFKQNFTMSESGIVSLEFTVMQSPAWIQFQVEYQTAHQTFYFSNPRTGNPFVQIKISETSLKVGTPFNLQVNTYPKVQDLYYVVFAKGMVVAAGKNKTTFSLTPEQSWAPAAQIIVYIHNSNGSFGDIIQSTHILTIEGTLNNQVSLSWTKNTAKPLESLTLSVSAKESRSLVGLRVVEKGSTLGDGNDLTAKRVDNLFSMYYESFPMIGSDAIIYNTNEFNILPINENLVVGLPQTQSKPQFTDTWIWLDTNISSSLSRNIQVTVPDKNTTWVATAFVMSEGLGLGFIDVPIELSVVKPLILTLNMPNMLTRGEQFILEVMLSNTLKEDMQVTVMLESSNSFDIIVPNNTTVFLAGQRNVTISRENGTVVFFPIQPKVLGNITITVNATSKAASDTLTKYIIVRPEGVKYYYSEAVLFDVYGSGNTPSTVSRDLRFIFPSDLVQGSEEAFITVVGDLLEPSINGLESLIVMPYGCGEQNMIVFAPNIYVLFYLKATNQLTENIKEKSIGYMEQGYQRELLYPHFDGSFSAFGNFDASGSTWLTSFVFRCFLQARPFIYINPDVLNRAVNFLVQHQNMSTGIFSEPGRVIHRDLQGGQNGPITLTAYIVTSLLQDEYYRKLFEANVQKAVQYLEAKYDEGIASNYTLSVVAYALTLANSTRAQAALNLLNSRATNIGYGGTKYWSTPQSANFYWQPRTTDIETAAYALLSFHRQNRIADGIPVMKWISQQRNQLGGYVSTQDTVMALQALSQFAAALPRGETSLVVNVTGPGSFVPKTFQVNSNLVLQRKQIEISQPLLSVTATAVGYGLALVQLNVVYNRKALSRRRRSTESEAFNLDLNVKEDASNIHKLTLDISMSFQGEGNETGMVLVEVGFLNGFQLGPESIPITEPVASVEPKENKVYLYLYSLTRDTVTVSVPMIRSANVARSQDAVVTITEYYNTRNTVSSSYNSAKMKNLTVCDFCGFNCTQCQSNVEKKSQTNSAYKPTFFTLCIFMSFLSYLF
ncbi:CD109 antigen-like [Pyxicephalus adspersus]|uniref:CD109 antigen-like n=1 Tax=Pyxicephalus adspersus TaxID=30357 RepID=UPI003B5B6D8C